MVTKAARKKAQPAESAAIVVQPERHVQENSSVEALIQQGIERGLTVDTMERLLAMRKEVKAEQAKEAFVQALTDFQSEVPTIQKTKKVMNKDGRTVRYSFAPLDSIVEQIRIPLKKYGLSYRWETKNTSDLVTAICTITHVFGHSESSSFEVPIDPEGFMTKPQKYASALTFAKRYSLTNSLGISTGDEDTDATDVGKERDALNPKAKIMFLLRTLKEDTVDKDKIAAAVKRITSLPLEEKNYETIIARLETQVQENHEDPEVRG